MNWCLRSAISNCIIAHPIGYVLTVVTDSHAVLVFITLDSSNNLFTDLRNWWIWQGDFGRQSLLTFTFWASSLLDHTIHRAVPPSAPVEVHYFYWFHSKDRLLRPQTVMLRIPICWNMLNGISMF